jgi:hypothetical protein
MYSHEIEELLRVKNYLLNRKEYNRISDLKNNPQINHIKYDTFNDNFEIDTNDNYHFKVKIKKSSK